MRLRTTRIAAASLGALAVVVALTLARANDADNDVFFVLVTALSAMPFALYAALIRSVRMTIAVGLALLIATVAIFTSIAASDSSTAAIGYGASAIINLVIVTVGAVIDSFVSARPSSLPRSSRWR